MQDLLIIHMSTKVKDTIDDCEIVTDLFPYAEEGKDLIVFGTTVGSKPIALKIRRPTYSEEVDLQTIESLISMNDAKKIGVDQDGDVVYAFRCSEKKANEVRRMYEQS